MRVRVIETQLLFKTQSSKDNNITELIIKEYFVRKLFQSISATMPPQIHNRVYFLITKFCFDHVGKMTRQYSNVMVRFYAFECLQIFGRHFKTEFLSKKI